MSAIWSTNSTSRSASGQWPSTCANSRLPARPDARTQRPHLANYVETVADRLHFRIRARLRIIDGHFDDRGVRLGREHDHLGRDEVTRAAQIGKQRLRELAS